MKKVFKHSLENWYKWMPITISIIAVIISVSSFYFQYIRVKNDVKAIVLGFTIENKKPYTYVSDIVFVNNGNRPCSIINAAILMQNTNLSKLSATEIIGLLKSAGGNVFTGTMGNDWRQGPFTIEQKSITTKRITFGYGELPDTRFSQFGQKDEVLEFCLAVQLIDSEGNYHKIITPVCQKIVGNDGYFPKECPISIRLLPSKDIDKDSMLLSRIQLSQIDAHQGNSGTE